MHINYTTLQSVLQWSDERGLSLISLIILIFQWGICHHFNGYWIFTDLDDLPLLPETHISILSFSNIIETQLKVSVDRYCHQRGWRGVRVTLDVSTYTYYSYLSYIKVRFILITLLSIFSGSFPTSYLALLLLIHPPSLLSPYHTLSTHRAPAPFFYSLTHPPTFTLTSLPPATIYHRPSLPLPPTLTFTSLPHALSHHHTPLI